MWVSKEKCKRAREYDVLSYLRIADPGELVRVSRNEYCLRSHDSFRISNGKWHWWSRGKAGHTAVDYLVEVKGYSFPFAVNEVLRAMGGMAPRRASVKEKSFTLPAAADNNDAAKEYLKSRGINEWLIDMLITGELIYEDKRYHGVIFVGTDYENRPKHAAFRAADSQAFKLDVSGSDKRFCFRLPYRECRVLRVFEGPVDLLSYVTLCINEGIEWQYDDMITVCGVHKMSGTDTDVPLALSEYLRQNPKVEHIFVHFDNDEVGASAARGIMRRLADRYDVINMPPPVGKDYNEYLRISGKEKRRERENND